LREGKGELPGLFAAPAFGFIARSGMDSLTAQ
jgi:hypothetical protein